MTPPSKIRHVISVRIDPSTFGDCWPMRPASATQDFRLRLPVGRSLSCRSHGFGGDLPGNGVINTRDDTFAFLDDKEAIHGGQIYALDGAAARPVNLHGVDTRRLPQTKMQPLVVGGLVTPAAHHVATLPDTVRIQVHRRSHGVTRALW